MRRQLKPGIRMSHFGIRVTLLTHVFKDVTGTEYIAVEYHNGDGVDLVDPAEVQDESHVEVEDEIFETRLRELEAKNA